MGHKRTIGALGLLLLLLCPAEASADTWQSSRYHLSLTGPSGWTPMSEALLASANSQVSHVTGRGFIAGFTLNSTETLVFPYLLVQFKPYTVLPRNQRPVTQRDERGKLQLLCDLIGAFQHRGPLPKNIDTPQFIDRFGNQHARLVRLDDDGRFDFSGRIPHLISHDPIRYHTHGVIGKDGVALATIFTIEDYNELGPIIANEMRTLAFDPDYSYAALPEAPPQPDAAEEPAKETDTHPTQETPATSGPDTTDTQPATGPNPTTTSGAKAQHPADSGGLIWLLFLFVVALISAMFITWFVIHQKAEARRERKRARRERLYAAQRSAQVNHQPRQAQPTKAVSRDKTGHQSSQTSRPRHPRDR